MTARILLNTALTILLTATVVTAAGLIWLAAAEPEVLASAHGRGGWSGLALAAASRVLSVLW
jgi:hypothetical protein